MEEKTVNAEDKKVKSINVLKEWHKNNPDKLKEHNYKRSMVLAEKCRIYRKCALEYLGSKCTVCLCTDINVLNIDHINGGGGKEVRARNGTTNIHKEVMAGLRPDLRILCSRCNIRARYYGSNPENWPDHVKKMVEKDKEFNKIENK